VAYYDACGRRIETDCGCTVVRYQTVAPACCDMATSDGVETTTAVGPTLAAAEAKPAPAVRSVMARAGQRR
jgi:hypothetical protein